MHALHVRLFEYLFMFQCACMSVMAETDRQAGRRADIHRVSRPASFTGNVNQLSPSCFFLFVFCFVLFCFVFVFWGFFFGGGAWWVCFVCFLLCCCFLFCFFFFGGGGWGEVVSMCVCAKKRLKNTDKEREESSKASQPASRPCRPTLRQ